MYVIQQPTVNFISERTFFHFTVEKMNQAKLALASTPFIVLSLKLGIVV
jgi:hypothetical protein